MNLLVSELYKVAIKFDLGVCKVYKRPVVIEASEQNDGTRKWVLKMDGYVMSQYACFVCEPLPSERSDEFIKITRFNSIEECYLFWVNHIKEKRELYQTIKEMKEVLYSKIN
jgi:hypothetical protein